MLNSMRLLYLWLADTRGATAIEYGLILAGICLATLAAISLLGDNLYNFFYDDLPEAIETE